MTAQLLREIIGQDQAVGFLREVIVSDKIASAYLFTGIQGIGKKTTAMAFALLLNCMHPVDGDACRICSSCKKIINRNHPDLILIEPDQDKKAIGIDQIREINRHLAFSPVIGPYRIVIIDPAEKMSDEAANAFLKTLEEPPPGNLFILNARDPGQLFPTIVSRCQRVPFKPLPTEAIVRWLVKEGNADKEEAKILARLSEGSLGEALRLANDKLVTERVNLVSMVRGVTTGTSDDLLDLAQRFYDLGKGVAHDKELKDDRVALMLGLWKSWFRDMLLIKLGGNLDLILNSDLRDHLREASALYSVDGLMKSVGVIARAERDLMENKNVLFLLERSLIGLRSAARV
jgi:DNA polymerase-3 subunit delta'